MNWIYNTCFHNNCKAFVILVVIALTIRKCWNRWSVATTDPMQFSNFARMKAIETLLATSTTGLTRIGRITRIALWIKYDELVKEAGVKFPRKKKKKVPVNYPRPKGRELRVFASTEPLVLTQ